MRDKEAIQNKSGPTLTEAANVAPVPNHWWQIADLGVFGLWLTLVGIILRHHEPWADEAQAWLIARDLDLKTIWFHELRYEGTPGLWHTILWIAQHWFHAPYAAMGVIGMLCAAAGVAFVLWKAPFPRPLRYLLVFSYFMAYQYAVVARSYNLLPVLVFAAAHLYGDREHPARMTLVLIVLANVAVHGAVIAAALGLCYLIEALREWPRLSQTLHRRYVLCIGAMLLTFAFLFVILKPTPDVLEFVANKNPIQFHRSTAAPLSKLTAVVSGAFLDNTFPSALFLTLAAGWCFMRRKLLPFVLPLALLLLLYVYVHGLAHHHGTVFLAAIAGLWIAWPTDEEMRTGSRFSRQATFGMITLLVCLFGWNTYDAAFCMRIDYQNPYSGAADAAAYLQSIGADKSTIFGYTYGISAVQAYFDHNILENSPTTYYHEGFPLYGFEVDLAELQARRPQYAVMMTGDPERDLAALDPALNRAGYHAIHVSDGFMFFKRSLYERQMYLVYARGNN